MPVKGNTSKKLMRLIKAPDDSWPEFGHGLKLRKIPYRLLRCAKNLECEQKQKNARADAHRHRHANGPGGEPSQVPSHRRWIRGRGHSSLEARWRRGRMPKPQQSPHFVVIQRLHVDFLNGASIRRKFSRARCSLAFTAVTSASTVRATSSIVISSYSARISASRCRGGSD